MKPCFTSSSYVTNIFITRYLLKSYHRHKQPLSISITFPSGNPSLFHPSSFPSLFHPSRVTFPSIQQLINQLSNIRKECIYATVHHTYWTAAFIYIRLATHIHHSCSDRRKLECKCPLQYSTHYTIDLFHKHLFRTYPFRTRQDPPLLMLNSRHNSIATTTQQIPLNNTCLTTIVDVKYMLTNPTTARSILGSDRRE